MPLLQNRRVLVTGGAGLIGSHLVDLLRAERNADVTILDSLEPQTHAERPSWIPKDCRFLHGDVRHEADLTRALEGVEFVFHLAAFGGFTDNASKYFDVNTTGTIRLFEALRAGRHTVEKVVVASSQGIYGEGSYRTGDGQAIEDAPPRSIERLRDRQWDPVDEVTGCPLVAVPTREDKRPRTDHIYSLSKFAAERSALALGRQWSIPTCALRYAVTYGPRQSLHNPYTGVTSIFSSQILLGRRPVVFEDGHQTRDFLYVKDNARGNLFAMESEATAGRALNLATGVATSVRDLVSTLGDALERPTEAHAPGLFRPADVRHLVLDSSELGQLGFHASVTVREGIAHFAAWVRDQPAIEDRFTPALPGLLASGVVHRARLESEA